MVSVLLCKYCNMRLKLQIKSFIEPILNALSYRFPTNGSLLWVKTFIKIKQSFFRKQLCLCTDKAEFLKYLRSSQTIIQ